MMKYILFVVLFFGKLSAENFTGFEHFNAPEIVGAYFAAWNPLGVTDKGFDFSVGFNLRSGDESIPQNFWIGKKTQKLIEVNSLAAVNYVIGDNLGDQVSDAKDARSAIDAARKLLSARLASRGQTGFPLYFETPQTLYKAVARLKSAGLDQPTADLLLRLGQECGVSVNVESNELAAVWYEVDRLGGIEKATIRGSIKPLRIISILRESIFDAGKVRPDLLKRENIFDPSLIH